MSEATQEHKPTLIMETIPLPHFPEYPLRVCLFKNVQNAPFLRQQLLEGNQDFEYAFLDASVLLFRKQILAACFQAINDSVNGRLKTRNVHSEIVFALSPNNNIAESFRRFGISNGSTTIVAIKVGGDWGQIYDHLNQHVQGEPVPLSDKALSESCDYAKTRKVYRVALDNDAPPGAMEEAEAFMLGTMALKGT